MKHILFLFVLALLTVNSFGQTSSRKAYIRKYQLLAIKEMKRSGIPASITMAQGCLESGDGKSELARKSNNHFGIKCKKSWKGKKVYYDDDRRHECFRKYPSVKASYIDHTNFLKKNSRYASLFKLKHTDYKGWARGLKKAGYATARNYDKRLIKIIEDNKLYRLDRKNTFKAINARKHENDIAQNTDFNINAYGAHKKIRINHLKAVVTRQGDTFKMLAQELGLTTWELYKYNDHKTGYNPIANEVVYIQKKRKRASRRNLIHQVQKGENMHFISQKYGIRLRPLYRRNGMKQGQQPSVGQIIYLRHKLKK